jgi:hypothetical protein
MTIKRRMDEDVAGGSPNAADVARFLKTAGENDSRICL